MDGNVILKREHQMVGIKRNCPASSKVEAAEAAAAARMGYKNIRRFDTKAWLGWLEINDPQGYKRLNISSGAAMVLKTRAK